MTARTSNTSPRPTVHFNEVVQFDDDDSGCLCVEKTKPRIPISTMEQSRWLPSLDSPESSDKKGSKAMPLRREIMKDDCLPCPPMPPRLPIRWPSSPSLNMISERKNVSSTTASSSSKTISFVPSE
ncbi:unnamed protein product [Cylindrotheca closterium]|uniref:Uncharacterized protein n=1 Tax=Cylindrotheca closterium TaxID=2856 RepID=A0AAD2G7C0_9STRA|nr:unnamed protein product [Cylindrotheca closterium]